MPDEPFQRTLRKEMTPAERYLWRHVMARKLAGLKFRRQERIGRWFVDFYCAEKRLVIELDGSSHDNRLEEDEARENALRALGLEVLRFTNYEVLDHVERVLIPDSGDCRIPPHFSFLMSAKTLLSLDGRGL